MAKTKGRKTAECRPLLVVDGDSFAHRAYHALPKSIHGAGRLPAGAIVGFSNYILRLWQEEDPRCVLVAWDTLGSPTYRQELLPSYQSGRVFEDDLLRQLDLLPEFVAACGFLNAKHAGFEADDFLAAAVTKEVRRGGTALVATSDRDAFQLVTDSVTILQPGGGALTRIGLPDVMAKYGVAPEQVPDFIALRGDPSDKIPGAIGVGPKTAADLLRRYGTLDALLKAGKFAGQAEQLKRYAKIATMQRHAPVPRLQATRPTWDVAGELAARWGLQKLAERLAEMARTPSGSK